MATKKPTTKAAKADASVKEAKTAVKQARAEALKAKAERLKAQTSHIGGFMNFVREQGVIGLAVGLAIGTAAGASVKSIVDNFINPIVGFLLGGANLSNLKLNTGLRSGGEELVFGWGAIISSLITLTATALVVYFIIHGAKLDRLDKKKS